MFAAGKDEADFNIYKWVLRNSSVPAASIQFHLYLLISEDFSAVILNLLIIFSSINVNMQSNLSYQVNVVKWKHKAGVQIPQNCT